MKNNKPRHNRIASDVSQQKRRASAVKPYSQPALKPKAASDVEKLLRIERRKARKRAIGMSILVLLVMLLTTVLIIMVMNRTKPRPRLQFIQEGTIAHTINSTGLILRDESVFNSTADGVVKQLATEGSRVSIGQKLALIIPEDQEDKIRELQKFEQDIVDLQIELINSGKVSGARAIYDESNAAISSVVNLVRGDMTRNDLSNLSSYSTSISVLIDQRSTKLLPVDFMDARIDQLKSSKNQLELSLGLDSGTLTCKQPGILSFRLDGFESQLGLDAALSMTADQVKQYIDQSSEIQPLAETVEMDDPVLRITSSLHQIFMFYLPDESAESFKIDEFHELSIPADGISVPDCQVIRSEDADDGALVAFKTNRRIEWFTNRRQLDAELVLSHTTGLRVPFVSLIDFNEKTLQAGIMIVKDGYTRISRVRVLDYDSDYAIIEAIDSAQFKPDISTIVVINPGAVEEGVSIGE